MKKASKKRNTLRMRQTIEDKRLQASKTEVGTNISQFYIYHFHACVLVCCVLLPQYDRSFVHVFAERSRGGTAMVENYVQHAILQGLHSTPGCKKERLGSFLYRLSSTYMSQLSCPAHVSQAC